MKSKGLSALLVLIFIALIGVGAGVGYMVYKKPEMLKFVEEKMKSIVTPKPPLDGNLTPARDLRGTWVSSLSGKGLQVFGKFTTGNAVTTVYEDGDIELIIDTVENNIASGKIRYSRVCAYGQTVAPKPVGTISVPKTCVPDSGYFPTSIRVSGSALDFFKFTSPGASGSMAGSFTTDIMSGNITINVPPYGDLKGEFRLSRKN